MPRLRPAFVCLAAAVLVASHALEAEAYRANQSCGGSSLCTVVDVLDRGGIFGELTFFSSGRVTQAWDSMVTRGLCTDIADVVVGGTFGENGAPGNSVPAGFAQHLRHRCTLVVHYELEGPVFDFQAYEDSTEHGRKALAIVLNRLDRLRTAAGKTSRLRVWGHSKGAAIVESTWRMEARNRNTKFITRLSGRDRFVDACPSNNCYYFGFGYPWQQERLNRFSISRATASTWSSRTDGYIAKPSTRNRDWWRLTTFTNLSDPVYECNLSCAWQLIFNSRCHLYDDFLRDEGYGNLDDWNEYTASSSRPAAHWVGDFCDGDDGSTGTFALTPEVTTVVPRERVNLALEWTVPEGGWRTLDEVALRLRDGDDILLWVRFDEAANLLRVYDARREQFRGEGEPGSRNTLKGRGAKLHLAGSRILADGAADPSVILDLEVSFKRKSAGREVVIEVLATDDLGAADDFVPAGSLTVLDVERKTRNRASR